MENPIRWDENRCLPRGVAAALTALNFSRPSTDLLRSLSEAEWHGALDFLDRAGLTLIFCARFSELLPRWVQQRFERNLAGNTERLARLRKSVEEIARLFQNRGIEYLLLKGFSQEAGYVADAQLRVQYDIDLFAPAGSLLIAREALRELDYEPIGGTDQLPIDHLAPMFRRTAWQWRGDFFDPDIPGPVDLHFRFWDAATERLDAPGIDAFWDRRVKHENVPVLDARDRLGYAALHSLRHLLRASVRVSHIYEIAYFLENQAGNAPFWTTWRELHPEPLRRLESISFRFAAQWFGCRVPTAVQEEISRQSESVSEWFERHAASPVEALFHPNKRELWLHFALLDSARDRRAVFVRRVFPSTLPPPIVASVAPGRRITPWARLSRRVKYAARVGDRALYHTRTLPAVLWQALQWKLGASGLTRPFWIFLGAASLYNLGNAVFFLLYNLFLLDRGYREDLLGTVTAAFSMGNIAGVLPAANLAHRIGLKRAIQICFIGTAVAVLLRSTVANEPALLATAFLGGLSFSIWAVSISPAVAALTSERSRPAGFSIIFGSGIGLGIVGSLAGGHLPGWIAAANSAIAQVQAKQFALAATGALVLIALWPLSKLALEAPVARETRTYPRNPFVVRFLAAMAVWAFAMGALNPLFNAYLSRQFHLAVEKIGLVLSLAQAAQVAAVLMAPLLLRKTGLVRGVAATQLVTALCLALLAGGPAVSGAAILYAGYTSFQYMTEPGTYALLMNRVAPGERSGASGLNFLVLFLAQAISASIAGRVVARFGYAPMLAGASIAAAAASLLFWRLLRKFES